MASGFDQQRIAPPLTPLRIRDNVFLKLEAFNHGGTHKARAARFMVEGAIERGLVGPDKEVRLLEKTGGSLGIGLAYEASKRGIGVDLVIGLSFSPLKRLLCQLHGARLVGLDMLHDGMQPKQVIEALLGEGGQSYLYLDQFNNLDNLAAHVLETGPELADQLLQSGVNSKDDVVFVASAGTGASFTGIARAIRREMPRAECVLVLPEGCNLALGTFREHVIEGVAVGVVPPFLDHTLVTRTVTVTDLEARDGQASSAREFGFYSGISSGANYHVARSIAASNRARPVVTLAYDAGEAYLAAASTTTLSSLR